MKITPHQYSYFFNNLSIFRASLLYGYDAGKIKIILSKIQNALKKKFKAELLIKNLDYKLVCEEPSFLFEEINMYNFFTTKKLIILENATEFIDKAIKSIILSALSNDDIYIVLLSSALSPRSSLRLFFENTENLAVIACYVDENKDLKELIIKYIRHFGLIASDSVVTEISDKLSGDRLLIYSEIMKLFQYLDDRREITLHDVELCVVNYHNVEYFDVIAPLLDKNLHKFNIKLKLFMDHGEGIHTIVYCIYNYLERLQILKGYMAKEGVHSIVKFINKFYPPIFYKHIPIIEKHISKYSAESLNNILQMLIKADLMIKENNIVAYEVVQRFAINLMLL